MLIMSVLMLGGQGVFTEIGRIVVESQIRDQPSVEAREKEKRLADAKAAAEEAERERAAREAHARAVATIPWDLKLSQHLFTFISKPQKIRRGILWLLQQYPHVRSFLVAMTGGFVSGREFRERQEVCSSCNFRKGPYCGACTCPRWPLARLSVKNRLRKWFCPKKKHERSRYPDWMGGVLHNPAPKKKSCGKKARGR
jgi:hypothetical protein